MNFANLNFRKFFNIDIFVQIGDPPSQLPKKFTLNRNDNLSNIREILEKENVMSDTLLFAQKNNGLLAEIRRNGEEDCKLYNILNDNILYLVNNSNPDWKFLNKLRKLDYGRTITFNGIKISKKRAFEMKGCKVTELGAEKSKNGNDEFKSEEEWMMKTNLFFTSDINVENLVKLRITVEKSRNKTFKLETNSSYRYKEFGKASLEFSECLEPTKEFIDAVNNAIQTGDAEDFKQIIEEYGQFIPIEVILGGRAYYEGQNIRKEYSEENSRKDSVNTGAGPLGIKLGNGSIISKGILNSSKHECSKFIGGKCNENFDEKAWAKSLEDFRHWDCIEFKNPISIFQPLPEDLRKKIILSLGKRIHYSIIENAECKFEELGEPFKYELRIPSPISNIIRNKDTDCNFFATVIDAEDNTFNCQMLCPPKAKPILLIHCIQEKVKQQKCKLKIGWMVIGYYKDLNFILSDFDETQLNIIKKDLTATSNTHYREFLDFEYNSISNIVPCIGIPVLKTLDLSKISHVIGHRFFNVQEENKIGSYTFSYCLKDHNCVELPEFTFYTLIISNYYDRKAYGISPCKRGNGKRIKDIVSFARSTQLKPKYVSLILTAENNYGPIFLRQKAKKVEYIHVRCDQNSCICKMTETKENLKYSFFDPTQDNED
ncbi:9905_t:CDS:2 [Funneliformis mosseae]|uniref:9905_t:CDS:1 n=1 Tax=Funneliformis mosseae TaxID=27381 RepID=A0A9N9APL3_FUNMO|nr:9905_t:CDS:2 [Funneliformis mosseae]